jgi:hypothetical protein
MFAGLFIKTCLQKKAAEVTVSAALIFQLLKLANQTNKINHLYTLKANSILFKKI